MTPALLIQTPPWADEAIAANGRSVKENFAQWFRVSQVKSVNGEPLVVCHGSCYADGFAETRGFSYAAKGINDYGDAEIGFFFGGRTVANTFAGESENSLVLPVYLSIQEPARFEWQQWCQMLDSTSYDGWAAFKKDLLAKGHDGIFIKGDSGAAESYYGKQFVEDNWIAFHGHQIKSAIGNCGLYLAGSDELTDHEAQRAILRAQRARDEATERILSRHEPRI